jgi:hypothetical protein
VNASDAFLPKLLLSATSTVTFLLCNINNPELLRVICYLLDFKSFVSTNSTTRAKSL